MITIFNRKEVFMTYDMQKYAIFVKKDDFDEAQHRIYEAERYR